MVHKNNRGDRTCLVGKFVSGGSWRDMSAGIMWLVLRCRGNLVTVAGLCGSSLFGAGGGVSLGGLGDCYGIAWVALGTVLFDLWMYGVVLGNLGGAWALGI